MNSCEICVRVSWGLSRGGVETSDMTFIRIISSLIQFARSVTFIWWTNSSQLQIGNTWSTSERPSFPLMIICGVWIPPPPPSFQIAVNCELCLHELHQVISRSSLVHTTMSEIMKWEFDNLGNHYCLILGCYYYWKNSRRYHKVLVKIFIYKGVNMLLKKSLQNGNASVHLIMLSLIAFPWFPFMICGLL